MALYKYRIIIIIIIIIIIKMHGLDTSNVSSRVETWRDEPSEIWV